MWGAGKYLEYYERFPHHFFRKNGSGNYQTAKGNIKKLKTGYLFHFKGCVKEFLIIPIGFTNKRIFTILLSGDEKVSINTFHKRYFKMGHSWMQSEITQVNPADLCLYVHHPYKTDYLVDVLKQGRTLKLPIRKLPEGYTPEGMIKNA